MQQKIYLIIFLFSLLTTLTQAQSLSKKRTQNNLDSLRMEGLSEYAKRYPQLRQGFVMADIIGKANFKTELNGQDIYEGDMQLTRIRSNFIIPVAQWGRNVVTGSVSYQQMHFKTDNIRPVTASFIDPGQNITKSRVGFTGTFARADSIFNRPINYSTSVTATTDEFSSFKRINYMGSFTTPIKRSATTLLTMGLVVIIDPSAVSPVIPIISYWHKFKADGLELFVDLPSRISLRKQFTKKTWGSIGTELGNNLFFFDMQGVTTPQDVIYATVELRSGATFEYQATKKIILGVNGGLYTTASSRLFDRNKKPTDYFVRTLNGSAPFVSFSISFLPFFKSLK